MISMCDEVLSQVVETARRFASRELSANVHERDCYPHAPFAENIYRIAEEVGLAGISLPESAGGVDLPPEALAPILECASCADPGLTQCLLSHNMAAFAAGMASSSWGTLPSPLEGKPWAYPLYMDAYDKGDVPTARSDGNHVVVSGAVPMVACAPVAAVAVLPAKLDNKYILMPVNLSQDGVKIGEPLYTLGMHSCPTADITLSNYKAPKDLIITGNPDAIQELHFRFYPAAAAISLGILHASLEFAVSYGKERYQGGKMIVNHSQLRTMYGRMEADLRAIRQAVWRSAEQENNLLDRMAAKCAAGDAAVRGTTDGVQLIGGYGYTREYPQEQRMRDARQSAELLGSPQRLRLAMMDMTLD